MAFSMKGLFGRKNDGAPQFPRVSSAAGEARIPSANDLLCDERLGVAFDTPSAPDFEATAKRLVGAAAAHPAFHESGIDQYPRTLLGQCWSSHCWYWRMPAWTTRRCARRSTSTACSTEL